MQLKCLKVKMGNGEEATFHGVSNYNLIALLPDPEMFKLSYLLKPLSYELFEQDLCCEIANMSDHYFFGDGGLHDKLSKVMVVKALLAIGELAYKNDAIEMQKFKTYVDFLQDEDWKGLAKCSANPTFNLNGEYDQLIIITKMLFAIVSSPDCECVVLFNRIEEGLDDTLLQHLWPLLITIAKAHNCRIIATTSNTDVQRYFAECSASMKIEDEMSFCFFSRSEKLRYMDMSVMQSTFKFFDELGEEGLGGKN